jgi:hypothetical protein
MPYYQYDIDEYDEDAEYDEEEEDEKEPEKTEESYEPVAGAIFRFDTDLFVKGVRDALVEKGITTVNCHYDGGYDEGFAHFDNAVCDGAVLTPAALVEMLKGGPILDPETIAQRYQGFPQHALESMFGEMATQPAGLQIAGTLEAFADRLARALLGRGFGTGEYTMRGRFRANLETGELIDLKDGE